jgi:hypothetical protein
MFRPIRVDHTNCLQVAIKTHSFWFFMAPTKLVPSIGSSVCRFSTQRTRLFLYGPGIEFAGVRDEDLNQHRVLLIADSRAGV